MMEIENIISNFLLAKTEGEIDIHTQAIVRAVAVANPEDKKVLKGIISVKTKMMIEEANKAIAESQNYITTPEYVIDLNEWVTIKEYAKRFQVASTNVVSNWIKRGIVPAENIKILPMLNGIKVIKAVRYL